MSVTVVLIWFLVLMIGCDQQPALIQGQTNSSGLQPSVIHRPAPHYLEMSITPKKQEYKQADIVTFTIKIKNVWKESLHIVNTPNILVGPATDPLNKYDHIKILNLGNKTLKPGETIISSATWKQSGEPGWYQIEFGDIDLGHTTLSGGGNRFLIKYLSNKVQMKTIESRKKIKLPEEDGELTFVVKRIEMNEHGTVVYFDFNTKQEAPMGFQMALVRSNGQAHLEPEPEHGGEQSEQKNGVIHGLAKFNPTTTNITQLQIVITDWSVIHKGVSTEIMKGPWTVDIPLNELNSN